MSDKPTKLPTRFKVPETPISGLLRRLQTSAGWTENLTDDMKRRAIQRLNQLVDDEKTAPQVQIAAIACLLKASQVENETINAICRLVETNELAQRLDALETQLNQSGARESDFVEVDILGSEEMDN